MMHEISRNNVEDHARSHVEQHTENNQRIEAVKNDIQRPYINKVRKSTIKRRRPAYIYNNKSSVCRIINCSRNRNHKCCKKPTEKTTTENSLTTYATELYETTQYAEHFLRGLE